MRFMCMHKVTPDMEERRPPDPRHMEAIGALIGEQAQRGVFVSGEGLGPSDTRSRLTCVGGECRIEHGVKGRNELLAGFLMLKVKNREEALDWGRRYAKVVGDVELELGPVVEAWDLGFAPKPEGEVPLRVLLLHMADPAFEAGRPLGPRQKGDLTRLKGEMTRAGVLLAAETLAPSARSKRIFCKADGKHTVIDGPFAESKEMIAGFAILDFPSLDVAVSESVRFLSIFEQDMEADVRPVVADA